MARLSLDAATGGRLRGNGSRRFTLSRSELRRRLRIRTRELDASEQQRENLAEQVRVLEGLVVAEANRADGETRRANQAEADLAALTATVARQAEAEVNAITVPAARDRTQPAGDPTVETNVLTLWEKPEAVARPYAPWPTIQLTRTEPIAWRPGSPSPANIPGWAQPPQPASEADTQRLPAADSQRTGETPVPQAVPS